MIMKGGGKVSTIRELHIVHSRAWWCTRSILTPQQGILDMLGGGRSAARPQD